MDELNRRSATAARGIPVHDRNGFTHKRSDSPPNQSSNDVPATIVAGLDAGRLTLGDHLRGAAGLHADAEQAVTRLHRALLVAHDQQLCVATELGDEAEE